uniref:Uncharacterized protein n=1 Tax=viral metagenome TaxID=1070528 RepID=A0A6M3X5Q4_9ZZZZ
MNKIDIQRKRNDIRRLFKHSSGIHVNCIRINTGNTEEHERAKFDLCWRLQKLGHHFITEAEFEKGGRADLVNLDLGKCYEIVKSEGKKSIQLKQTKYPLPIEVFEI